MEIAHGVSEAEFRADEPAVESQSDLERGVSIRLRNTVIPDIRALHPGTATIHQKLVVPIRVVRHGVLEGAGLGISSHPALSDHVGLPGEDEDLRRGGARLWGQYRQAKGEKSGGKEGGAVE